MAKSNPSPLNLSPPPTTLQGSHFVRIDGIVIAKQTARLGVGMYFIYRLDSADSVESFRDSVFACGF